ncbi:2Fe-2S iron-sulfur cluster-binding protein [Halocola ammonii]
MRKFFPLKVSKINRETDDAVSIQLDISGLEDKFSYKHGQYITFKVPVNGEDLHRSYSLCSAPHESELRVAVKRVDQGKGSTFLTEELKEGDTLEAMSPEGNFTIALDEKNKKHYVFFAAGSGITPIFSIIKAVLRNEPESKLTLFYGNSSKEQIIFKDELDTLAQQNEGRLTTHHILTDGSSDKAIFNGRIDFGKTLELLINFCSDDLEKEYFICGPAGMMKSVQNALADNGIEKGKIHLEYFEAPGEENPEVVKEEDKDEVKSGFIGDAEITAVLDDEEWNFSLHTDGRTILTEALDQGADAPYSCRGGVCTTCMAKLVEGTVKMDSNFALTDQEIEDGYILACQSHPTSEKVKISWDDI